LKKLVLDTGVLIEYIVSRAPYRPRVAELFRAAREDRAKLYISTVTPG